MLLGESKQDITPTAPIELAGFAHRIGKASEVLHRLFLKTYYLQVENKVFLFLIADLIWWDTDYVKELKIILEERFQIPAEQICFHATHNHSGPQTSSRFSDEIGKPDIEYLTLLTNQVFKGIEESMLNKETVRLEIRRGTAKLGVNRRKKVNDEMKMEPNFEQSIDNALTVITFITNTNKKKAIWIHFSCHPTSTDANIISSEYTGVCCSQIEEKFDCHAAFLQGFCGDIRPALIKNGSFYRGAIKDMELIGKTLANKVFDLLQQDGEICKTEPLLFRQTIIPLSFSKEKMNDKIPEPLINEWPNLVNRINGKYEMIIQYIKICDGFSFICCNAELVEKYGRFIKQINTHILPLGYSNGMVGYICTEKQLSEGGYEAEESLFYFGYPSKLSSSTEDKIQVRIKELLGI